MAARRIEVAGSDAWAVAVISGASAAGVVVAGLRPTGSAAVDTVLMMVFVSVAVWCSASAPWWVGVVAAAGAAALAPNVLLMAVGVAAAVGGLAIGVRRRSLPWSRALVAGATVQVLARLGNLWWLGATAIIGIGLVLLLAVWGLVRRPSRHRRVLVWFAAASAAFVVLAVIGFAVSAGSARAQLEKGSSAARRGVDLLAKSDFAGAETAFGSAHAQFARADDQLSAPWGQLVRLVPVLAQHRHAATTLTDEASALTDTISEVLTQLDPDALRVVNGRIDVDAVTAFEPPLQRLNDALGQLADGVSRASNPWLVAPLQHQLDELHVDIAKQQARGDDALVAVRAAPALLGDGGKRVYFIAFTTPVQSRGLGGFMGNWAELTISDGRFDITAFGRTQDLEEAGKPTKLITGPQDFLDRYQGFGFVEPETGRTRPEVWHAITISPNFPSVAQVIAELYPQSGGKQLDGVIAMDVYAVAALLDITGPVRVAGLDQAITSANAADYLLRQQYLANDNAERIDVLEQVAFTTIKLLFTSTLPAPPDLAKLLGPLAAQGRLVAWSAHPDEQQLFERIHMSGALPELAGGDGLAVTLNNAGNNKIDQYLDGDVSYHASPAVATGVVSAELTINLTNSAPAEGLPRYVIGNSEGLAQGSNKMYLSIYTPLTFISATLDGEQLGLNLTDESGYSVLSAYLILGPGESTTVTVQLQGTLDLSTGYSLAIRSPPTVRPFPFSIAVDAPEPFTELVTVPGVRRFDVSLG